ncbi:MAG: HNH endonuclease [Anaerolineae bacterium]|nr:HNH endonuclease [Anaerolineae bacterium]
MTGKQRGPSYPDEWTDGQIQSDVRALAQHRCEQCGMAFRPGTNIAVSARHPDGRLVLGSVHHIDYDTRNNTYSNLVYLCQNCHAQVTGLGWKPGDVIPLAWKKTIPRWIVSRRLPYIENPQLNLFGDENA